MIKFVLAFALLASALPAMAKEHDNPGNGNSSGGGRGVYGAPGPVAGVGLASLPVLAIGYGVYWLVKRRRK